MPFVYRPDTAQYLNADGDWQADETWALTATDTEIAAPGNVGLAVAPEYKGDVFFDDFSIVPLPGGTFPSFLSESFDTMAPGGLPSGWTQWTSDPGQGVFSVTTTQPLSAPQGLSLTGRASAMSARAWSSTLQATDVEVSAAIFLNTQIPAQVIARGSNLNGTTPTFYAAQMSYGLAVELVKVVNGTTTTLGTLTSAGYFSQKWARLTLVVNGSSLAAEVYRPDTGEYLNSQRQWQSGQAYALVVNDTSLTSAGLVGLGRPASNSSALSFDDFVVRSAATLPPTSVTETFDTTTAGIPSGWTQWSSHSGTGDGLFAVSTTQPSSAPNGLANTTPGASATAARTWHGTFSAANVQVSASIYLDTQIKAQVLARGSSLNGSTPSFYAVQISRGYEAKLIKVVGGTTTELATITSPDYFSQKWVRVTLSAVGATLQVQLYRPDTNQYLSSGGVWQTAPAWAMTQTDTAITAAGAAGLGRAGSATGTLYFDDFQAVTLGGDSQAPGVTITAPASGATLSGPQSVVQVNATDNLGVTKVEFYLDGLLKSTDEQAPYNWTWDTTTAANGSHAILVKAYDAAGNIGQTSVTVTTDNDKTAPTVSFLLPGNGATISGTSYPVQATASDNVGVARVEFYIDSEPLPRRTDFTAPFSWIFNTTTIPNGAHTIKAKAYDLAGNVSTVASVSVTVSNNADTQPPTLEILSPTYSQYDWPMLYETYQVKVKAEDSSGIDRVEFRLTGDLSPRATV